MKKPKAVIEAEIALEAKRIEITAAKEALRQLEAQLSSAYVAVRVAREAADASQPQCRIVQIGWRSGIEKDAGRAVIVRRTPSGLLVVRPFGGDNESRFRWSEFSGLYRQAERGTFTSETRELRDVPAEFLPTTLGGRDVAPRADGGS